MNNPKTFGLTIGFTNQYYTLWNVGEPYKEYFGSDSWSFYMKQDVTYYQNLSKDLEEAKIKAEVIGEYRIDLDLKGEGNRDFGSFTRTLEKGTDLEPHQFRAWSKAAGEDIRISDNTSALWQMYLKNDQWWNQDMFKASIPTEPEYCMTEYFKTEEAAQEYIDYHTSYPSGEDRKFTITRSPSSWTFKLQNPDWVKPCIYARRRLIELSLLIRHNGQYMTPEYAEKHDKRKAQDQLAGGYHYETKDRVELRIMEIDSFGFDGQFGFCHIITYKDNQGRKFKYMGSSPPEVDKEEYTDILATIKHSEYKGEYETHLQRIKIK